MTHCSKINKFVISDSFFDIKHAYNGSFSNDNSAIGSSLSFSSSSVSSLPPINLTFGSEIFSIPPLKYIVPRNLYPILNVTDVPGLERTWIDSAGPFTFGLGQKWLENFYTAYDSKCLLPHPCRSFFFLYTNLSENLFIKWQTIVSWLLLFSAVCHN
jgi:hypothetical protein